jgi:hypothetical protein
MLVPVIYLARVYALIYLARVYAGGIVLHVFQLPRLVFCARCISVGAACD